MAVFHIHKKKRRRRDEDVDRFAGGGNLVKPGQTKNKPIRFGTGRNNQLTAEVTETDQHKTVR
jgi:hypothetical protein